MDANFDTSRALREFRRTSDAKLREKLLVHYMPLVHSVAGRMIISLPKSVAMGDLVSSGMMGLVKAIDRFDPEVGVKFETYAVPRIKGAIFDGLREQDWAPRSVRAKARLLEDALQRLTNALGRCPVDDELAQELGLDLDTYFQLLDETSVVSLLSLDEQFTSRHGETLSLFEIVEADEEESPLFGVEREDLKVATVEAIKNLPEQEKLVIALYYYEELTLKEIGAVMEITESRVSQIHTKAILSLRAQLANAFSM